MPDSFRVCQKVVVLPASVTIEEMFSVAGYSLDCSREVRTRCWF